MDLILSLEEFEEIEVPEEAEILISDPKEELAEAFAKIDNAFDVIDNLKAIRANIKKFGLTREVLHLINADGSFGRALGLTLPYYESDEVDSEDINMDDVPADDVLIASMEGLIGDTKDGLIKFFTYLRDKIKQFFAWIWSKTFGRKKQVEDVVKKMDPANIVKEASEKMEAIHKQVHEAATKHEDRLSKLKEQHEKIQTAAEEASRQKEKLKQDAEAVKKLERDAKRLAHEEFAKTKVKFYYSEIAGKMRNNFKTAFKVLSGITLDPKTGDTNFDDSEWNTILSGLGIGHRYVLTGDRDPDIAIKGMIIKHELKSSVTDRTDKDYALIESTMGSLKYEFDDMKYLGENIITLSKEIETIKRFSANMEKVCNECIKNRAPGDNLDVLKKIRVNANNLISLSTDVLKLFENFVTAYIQSGVAIHRDVLKVFMDQLGPTRKVN